MLINNVLNNFLLKPCITRFFVMAHEPGHDNSTHILRRQAVHFTYCKVTTWDGVNSPVHISQHNLSSEEIVVLAQEV